MSNLNSKKLEKINSNFLKALKKYGMNNKFVKCESDSRMYIYKTIKEFDTLNIILYVFLTPNSFSFHSQLCNVSSLNEKQEVINIINFLNVKFASLPIKIFLDEESNIILQAHTFFYEENCFNEIIFIKNCTLINTSIDDVLLTLLPLLSDLKK